MTSTIQNRLPAAFRSVYRLFLRTSSAAVLHHRQARRNIRQRWRPVFDAAVKVTKELQNKPENASITWIQGRKEWLTKWNERMDKTLALLYTASQSRGLPHKLSRNLAFMIANEKERFLVKFIRAPKWNPSSPQPPKRQQSASTKQAESLQNNTTKALNEVIRMAEASGNLSLGRNEFAIKRIPHTRKQIGRRTYR